MKCQVCGKESGKYPLCRECNELKNQGIIIKCDKCHTWHRKDAACPGNITSTVTDASAEPAKQTITEVPPVKVPDAKADTVPFLYEPKTALVTNNELDYYNAIKKVLPEGYLIFPQINLAAFISRTDGSHYQNELYRNIDFLITTDKYEPKIAVEINDRSHMENQRKQRDLKVHNILEEAGIPLLTLWTSYGVNPDYIKGKITELLSVPAARKHHFDPKEKEPAENTETLPQKAKPAGKINPMLAAAIIVIIILLILFFLK